MLAARRDLNPNLVPALLDAVTRVHRPGGILEEPGQFSSVAFADLPFEEDAARYIAEGPSFLYRGTVIWTTKSQRSATTIFREP